MNSNHPKKGFSLTELVVVMVLVGVIAAMAIPTYTTMVQKRREQAVRLKLQTIHAANLIYKAKNDVYYNDNSTNIADVNTALQTNVNIESYEQLGYQVNDPAYIIVIFIATDGNGVGVRLLDAVMDDNNPCCIVGTGWDSCISMPDC